MPLDLVKRFADPIHGTIELTRDEAKVVNTTAFQRLRNIKHLGLAHYVYAAADFSRFSHSLGACHIAGKIALAIQREVGDSVMTDELVQEYRLAALCHDIGHYPFSHATEHALDDHYKQSFESVVVDKGEDEGPPAKPPKLHLKHEFVGQRLLLRDKAFQEIRGKDTWTRVGELFTRESVHPYKNVISSDLDVDRIDYLLRTAHHTGLPYGHVDVEYLLSQATVDDQNRVCFKAKGLRAAEHLLLCRYFDYQKVAFHKTVVGLEWVLKEVIGELVRAGQIRCDEDHVVQMIEDGKQWNYFDDACVGLKIRELGDSGGDPVVTRMCNALNFRIPPKMVGGVEYIGTRSGGKSKMKLARMAIEHALPTWVKNFGIPRRCWKIWGPSVDLTKAPPSIPFSEIPLLNKDAKRRDEQDQALRIQNERGKGSETIMDVPNSLLNTLSEQTLYPLRLYVLPMTGTESAMPQIEHLVSKTIEDALKD